MTLVPVAHFPTRQLPSRRSSRLISRWIRKESPLPFRSLGLIGISWAILGTTVPAHAYIGPGAGFALVSSFGVIFVTAILAVGLLLIYPFRKAYKAMRRKPRGKAWVKRLLVVGLDGQDPKLTDKFLAEGKLPHFKKLAEMGCYRRLATTYPSVSPVAWSSFATGCHPAKHNIFDFLDRDRRTYLPVLSSTKIGKIDRFFKFAGYKFPLQKPSITLLRKSRPFWSILGDHDIWSTVIRVPITFPPDRFYGAQLSAMSVPDLLGTQGTFLLFTTRHSDARFKEGGIRINLSANGSKDRFETKIEGPENIMKEGNPALAIPLTIVLDRGKKRVHLDLDGEKVELEAGKLSDWVKLTFKVAPTVKATGITRMLVTELGDHFSLYMTPINLDPESPAMPISHPSFYSTYLSNRVGQFSTLGLAEDTWALNEEVTDDATFLQLTHDIDEERREMFFSSMDRLREGALVTVFDATDRIQHMFWRYIEEGHPAAKGKQDAPHKNAIEELYKRNDELVGKVMSKMKKGDLLFVISDHGFTSFRRGVNLNVWLLKHGYLALKEGCDGSSEWLRDVDWSKTRAYALGLTGMFLNLEGREAMGTVKPSEAQALKDEICAKLLGLHDEEKSAVGINEAFDTAKLYQGPYLQNAPDLLIGYAPGYRTSWDCASGVISGHVFEDNAKAWSGDHCVDPREVPGVMFCSKNVAVEDPGLLDLAPTALKIFGIQPPPHMDGKSLFQNSAEVAA